MADVVDKQTRSRIMASIRGKDTKPEMVLRRALHARGFRFRLHAKNVIGKPDLVFPRFRAVVFVHGCFWHRHQDCRYATIPSTRPEYWQAKFEANVRRDNAVRAALIDSGWRVAIVWECALRKIGQVPVATDILSAWLRSEEMQVEIRDEDTDPC